MPGRGVAIVPLVLGFLCFAIIPKAIKYVQKERKYGKYLKCSKCGKIYNYQGLGDLKCTHCQVELENLKGFFDRHPELK